MQLILLFAYDVEASPGALLNVDLGAVHLAVPLEEVLAELTGELFYAPHLTKDNTRSVTDAQRLKSQHQIHFYYTLDPFS